MKRIIFFLILTTVVVNGKTQVWAPSGATWFYDWAAMWTDGYVKIESTGDTIIKGKTCQILTKTLYSYDFINYVYDTSIIGHDYTYFENNIVYYYRLGQFFTLYNFNAQPGNSWVIAGWNNLPCDSTSIVDVDTTGLLTINSLPLKYLKTSPGQNPNWSFGNPDTLLERIGSFSYMFPEPVCVVDLYEGGYLRCYHDDTFGWYKKSLIPTCEYIYTGIQNQQAPSVRYQINLDPSSSIITVQVSSFEKCYRQINILDLLGKQIAYFITDKTKFTINISDLKVGMYLISITDNKRKMYTKKIIKNVP